MVLGTSINQSIPKPVTSPENTTINLKDIRTLAVNDIKVEKVLKLRLISTSGTEIGRSEINMQPFFISPNSLIKLMSQKFDITGAPADDTKKGLL